MMSSHGGNPIFVNKKIKIGRPEHSLTPTPLRPKPPSLLSVDVICVSPLKLRAFDTLIEPIFR